MVYVGLDVHESQVMLCALDEGGRVMERRTIRGGVGRVCAALRRLRAPVSVCFEASCGAGFWRDRLRESAARVAVADPSRLRIIWGQKRKNDKLDAERLAKLLLLDLAPEVHVPEVEVRGWRAMIEHRRRLLARRTAVKNAIRSHLRAHGKRAGRGLWTRGGLRWLQAEAFPTALAGAHRDLLLAELAAAETQLAAATRALDRVARRHPGVMLLMTIPGVGPRTAEAVMAYIDVAERFARSGKIGSCFGLVPSQDQSGAVNRLGRITRRGPSVVRWLLTEAAWQGARRSPTLKAFYERIRRNDPQRRKIAAVATAHYLARTMLAMLKTGEEWREAA